MDGMEPLHLRQRRERLLTAPKEITTKEAIPDLAKMGFMKISIFLWIAPSEGGNSGIQYRSFVKPGKHDSWRVGGYQG